MDLCEFEVNQLCRVSSRTVRPRFSPHTPKNHDDSDLQDLSHTSQAPTSCKACAAMTRVDMTVNTRSPPQWGSAGYNTVQKRRDDNPNLI